MLEKLIKSAIISSRILKIYDENLDRLVRPTLNLFIRKPFGFGFSTMADELAKLGLANNITEFTVPGIVGSVRGGRLYEGQLCYSGYKLTVFDEVMALDQKSKKTINQLTEYGKVTRTIQGFVERRFERDVVGGKYIVDKGLLELQIHTSCLFGTASDTVFQDPDIKMLLSRCFCLNLVMDKEEAIKLKKFGRDLRIDLKRIPEEPVDMVKLPADINELLLEALSGETLVPDTDGGYFTRCHDDLIRLSAVHCVARKDTEINEKDVKFALQFFRLHQVGYLGSQLSESALKVLEQCTGKTIGEIAKAVNLSERQVRRHLNDLMKLNLISKVENRYFKII